MTAQRLCFAAVLLLFASQTGAGYVPRIAIIIDDLGYRLDAGRRAIALPGPVAYAVIPGAPAASRLARHAHEREQPPKRH